ncbi:MAG TPA: Cna B-type domain-containing protein, partial [Candidatus Limnocylindria bacterium]|nr:Cna B-type domain-containing protein [Candidatus Limnocylindria bacterium]
FENLPVNYQGDPVTYTVDEPAVPDGYEKSIAGLTVTNTHIPEVTERTVTKVWDDNNNQDGLRAAVILQLKAEANGAEIPWATLKAASASGALMDPAGIVPLGPGAPLTHLFENLPVNYQGDPVTYTVEELFIPFGYTASYDQQTLTVTNTHIPFVTSVTVEKVWEDNGVTDPAHAAVTLKLTATAGGNPIDWATLVAASASGPLMDQDGEVTLGPDTPLTHEFTDLPAFYQGDPVTYTVDEPVVPGGYEKSVDGLTVTNTRLMMPDIPVRKVWDDQDDLYGLRPASVIIHLIRNEEATPYKQLELNEGNGWQGLFTNLPAKDGDGNNYIYSMREDRVPGYLEPVNTLEGIITFVFTNTLDTVDVPVDKAWDDLDDLHGLRPSGVTVALRQNGAPLTPNQERELNEGNGWSAVFTALPRLDQADMPFLYTVVEEQAQDYLPPQYLPGGEGGITVLNTLDLIRIGGTKTWDDGDDIDRIRPASITVRLMDGDTEVDARTVTAAEGWTYLFESLPRTRNGILIHYAVTEDGVPGYVLEPVTQPDFEAGAEDGTTEFTVDLVNTNPLPRNVTMIPVTKVWEHGTNTDLPEAITIRVMDGDTEVAVRTLREPWTLNVTGLPRLRDNGEPIIYTITEDPVPNYRTAIDQDARVITNTYVEPVTPRDVVLGLDTIYNTGDSFH